MEPIDMWNRKDINNQSMFGLRKSKLLSVVDVSTGLCRCFQLWV